MKNPWYRRAVFYHLYVRSFFDANGDGIGDIPGILERLDLLVDLGVDALWLAPFYPSPQVDFGYDVVDHCDVDPAYGTLDDLARLRDVLHQYDMRLVLDFVPNHTSDAHPWFREARCSRDAPKRGFYIWSDPAVGGGPPNNWCSIFGGPAWTLHPETGQYYLHSFLPGQPDLDWRNPEVAHAMHQVMRFWLDWGADGFRVDAVHQIIKDRLLRSNPPDPSYTVEPSSPAYDPFQAQKHRYDTMQPEVFDVVRGMRSVVDEYNDRVLIGETPVYDWQQYAAFLGDGSDLFHLAFNFQAIAARSLTAVHNAFTTPYSVLHSDAWPTLVLSNHDSERHVSRLSTDAGADDAIAKLSAAVLLACRGTPFLYNGDEIGMATVPVPREALRDPVGLFEAESGRHTFFLEGALGLGRDPSRTPMQWSNEPHGGFTSATPWLPAGDFSARNVEAQRRDPNSVWRFHKALITLRRDHPALQTGAYLEVAAATDVWAFERRHDKDRVLVLLNCARSSIATGLQRSGAARVLSGSHRAAGQEVTLENLELSPLEVLLLTA